MGTDRSSLSAFPASTRLMSLLFLCLLLLAPANAQNHSYEVSALGNFTSGLFTSPAGTAFMSTWNFSDENACAWTGVTCTSNYTVARLDLSGWYSGGWFFPDTLSSLRDLSHLDLSSNQLSLGVGYSLPLDVSSLTGLIWLDLSQNQLWGQLSSNISACQRLRFLSLSQNQLEGAIPSSLRDLKDLQFLLLDHNQFSGPLSTQITGLSNILSIDLAYNALNGSIPALPKSTKLVNLILDSNNFTQFEESWFSTVSQSLGVLSVSFNQLEEALPSEITLPNLQVFNMSGNRLSGNIPRFIAESSNISFFLLDLSQNQLTGTIPSTLLQGRTHCSTLNLSNNFLTGTVPFDGNSIFCVEALDLSHNDLSGVQFLPFNDSTASVLGTLRLGNNKLSGDAVDILISAAQLFVSEFRLENNLFTGDLSKLISTPENWTAGVFFEVVDLSNNYLQWSISDSIPDPITLTLEKLAPLEFRAGSNNFTGTSLPSECFSNQFQINTTISSSQLQVPQVLDLSDSHLKGSIYSTVFNSRCLPNIQFLNLSNNDIRGIVPDSIIDIPSLQVLDLSNNSLTGRLPLPPSSSSLNNPSFFEGNDGLCGYPLSFCPQDSQGTWIQWWVVLIIVGACVMIAMGSCLVATWRWRVYHKRHQQDVDLIKMLLEKESATIMPLRELKKATENFGESAQIGEGGFGTVYMGKLNNGTMVAIKRSKHEGSEKDKEQFLNEVKILSQVNHRNLVKLLGCCMENKIALLVFEYVPNGTLQEHLCGKVRELRLTWSQRVHIAMQVADALNYLHSATVIPIYHRDVKSTNILLDESLNAKVADFGISKLAPLHATHVSTIAIQGTIGYIDPEYYTSYKLTDKSDVYSFGVVLLELISAKLALDFQREGDETSLVHFASSCIARADWIELIDPALVETYNDLDGSGRKSILALSTLAFKCLEMQSKARPSMNEVLKELQNLSGELKGMSKAHLEHFVTDHDFENLQHDHTTLLFDKFSIDSSGFPMGIDGSGIQMSQLSKCESLGL